MRRRVRTFGLAAVASAGLTAACTSVTDGAPHHPDQKGVLSVRTDGGGGSWGIAPPRSSQRWSGTFGLYILCTRDGQAARLEDVTWHSSARPRDVRVFVRHIPARAGREPGKDYDPIGMLRGTPANRPRWGGTFVDYRGQVIDRRCRDGQPDPDAARDDLVFALTAGPGGAGLDDFSVVYSVDGRRYALDVAWSMALCGPDVPKGCDSV